MFSSLPAYSDGEKVGTKYIQSQASSCTLITALLSSMPLS